MSKNLYKKVFWCFVFYFFLGAAGNGESKRGAQGYPDPWLLGAWFCASSHGRGCSSCHGPRSLCLNFGAFLPWPLGAAVSLHQLGAGCAREPALSIFLALRMLLSVGHIIPMDALPWEARDVTPSSSQALFPVGKTFQGIFKVAVFAGGIWMALLGT